MVDTPHSLGMCVSHHMLLQFTNGICQRFLIEEAVYSSKLRQNLLTTAAVNNIDHNPSSATAKNSFHGSSIHVSLIQIPSHTDGGLSHGVAVLNQDISLKSAAHLSSTYTSLPQVGLRTKNFNVPVVQDPFRITNFLAAAEKE